jgi:putative spermidine/putrescine transport system substrate-binding protein
MSWRLFKRGGPIVEYPIITGPRNNHLFRQMWLFRLQREKASSRRKWKIHKYSIFILLRKGRIIMKKSGVLFCLFVVILLIFASACQPAATPTAEPVEPTETSAPANPMAELENAAKAEGEIVSYGLPDDWVNYGGIWKIYEERYGIPHLDTDMGSGEIIAALEAEKNAGVADITDLGINFANQVVEEGLSQPYEHAYWGELPEYAKDPNGLWSAAYWGAIGICVNTDLVEDVPGSWADLLDPKYKDTISMRDPRESGTGNYVVLGAAFGNGGSENDVQPGLDFFKQLYELGQMRAVSPSTANIQAGEVPIALFWDFDCLSKAESLGMPLKLVIPKDGTVAGLYIQFVTAAAPHPNAAKLMVELEYSDDGQLAYAQGFTHPIRDITLPADLLAKFPPAEDYNNVKFPTDFSLLTSAAQAIAEGWDTVAK